MAFDDDSRLVVKEGAQSRAAPSSSWSPSSDKKGSQSATQASSNAVPNGSEGGVSHPTERGTIACVQTFSTGLVVTTCSDGTVSLRGLHYDYDAAVLRVTARSGIVALYFMLASVK